MKKFTIILTILFAATFTAKAQWIQGDGIYGGTVMALAVSEDYIYAGTNNSVFLSTNNAKSWSQTALDKTAVRSLLTLGDNLFAGTTGGGVYRSTDHGASWTQTSLGFGYYPYIYCLAAKGNTIFAGTQNNGVYYSTDNGTNWTQTSLNSSHVTSLEVIG
ncbi:MAG: hypothetical protein M0P47_13030, partial [Bacteroidales bacterium]|nr:hypothetical protein [Bacteroidales bacterium]